MKVAIDSRYPDSWYDVDAPRDEYEALAHALHTDRNQSAKLAGLCGVCQQHGYATTEVTDVAVYGHPILALWCSVCRSCHWDEAIYKPRHVG